MINIYSDYPGLGWMLDNASQAQMTDWLHSGRVLQHTFDAYVDIRERVDDWRAEDNARYVKVTFGGRIQ